jgi:predicted N-acyltransferase
MGLIDVMALECKVFRSIDAIGRDSINSLAEDGFFTYEWFKTLETQQSFGISPFYLAVYNEDLVVAVAPCFVELSYFFQYGPQIRYVMPLLQKLLLLGHQRGFCQNSVLLCYSPFCSRSKILLKENSEKKNILNLLAKEIDSICKKERILFSSFLFVSEFDRLLMDNLQKLNYLKSPGITTLYLDIQWSSFEDYLKSLKPKTMENIRREIRKCKENGVIIEEQELGGLSENLSELLSNFTSKYDKNVKNVFNSSFFSTLSVYAQNKTKLFIAKKNNEVVGFSLLLRQGNILDGWLTGFKYEALSKSDFTYFNLCYYMPIQWAIEENIKKIYYRSKAEKVKLDRGCKAEKTYSFVKCHVELLGPLINNALKTPLYSYLSRRFSRSEF